MKLLIEFLPIVIFFAVFKFYGIFIATGALMATTLMQMVYWRIRYGRIEPMQWITLAVVAVLGGATLISHNEAFIKVKPTVLYLLLALALVVAQAVWKKNGIKALLGQQIELPDRVWNQLRLAWTFFFLGLAVLNLWVAHTFSTETWVNFKLFGTLGMTLIFVILQAIYMSRALTKNESSD